MSNADEHALNHPRPENGTNWKAIILTIGTLIALALISAAIIAVSQAFLGWLISLHY